MKRFLLLPGFFVASLQAAQDHDFENQIRPLLAEHCYKCHGEEKTKGKVDLVAVPTRKHLLAKPVLIKEMIDVLDAQDMPPEDEKQPTEADRAKLITHLKALLAESAEASKPKPLQIHRLNRFQYNNAIRDLFGIKKDIFPLTEKLMTRHTPYLRKPDQPLPNNIQVDSQAIAVRDGGGFQFVNPFPKDLRAAHGFDNQANQLTLSPLLLDAFLHLSVSILESPDFNEKNVGVWKTFFAEPEEGSDLDSVFKERIEPFLERAFRSPIQCDILQRYTDYAARKTKEGLGFTGVMKKVSSAVLSSPMFLFRHNAAGNPENPDWSLASKLSFFLWNSIPDEQLIAVAKEGKLSDPKVLEAQLSRMLNSPNIERFLDTFPVQWMQLENILAATPDPKLAKYYNLDKTYPAGLQMAMEPLLLFDAVFQENRPLAELINPTFAYRSDFLKAWYTTDLAPKGIDEDKLKADNQVLAQKKENLEKEIAEAQDQLDSLVKPVKKQILTDREILGDAAKPVDLGPLAEWEFDDSLRSSPATNPPLPLTAHGKIEFRDGKVLLNKAYLQSPKLPVALKAKTLEAWCELPNINQRGGGVMTLQGRGGFFDSIVYSERKNKHWISGSNGHSRTKDFPDSTPETEPNQTLHLVITYGEDGTTTMYRNGQPYGQPYQKGKATFPANEASVLFGLRHLPAGGNKYLNVLIDKARLYDRELTPEEVESSFSGNQSFVTQQELLDAMDGPQVRKYNELTGVISKTTDAISNLPEPVDVKKVVRDNRVNFENDLRKKLRNRTFQRVKIEDPRYGGILTNAALLSMTSGPKRTHPIARGAWIVEVLFNDPPPPPPNDVPALKDDPAFAKMTIREQFAKHREHPDCAGCHSRLDPLGFALENYDITGRWRDKYKNGRYVDPSGKLLRKYPFSGITEFKASLGKEDRRFAKAFTAHLLRYALSRELAPADTLVVEDIVEKTADNGYSVKSLIRQVVESQPFLGN